MMSRFGTLAIAVCLLAYGLFFVGTTALPAQNVTLTKRDDEPVPVPGEVLNEFELWAPFAAAAYCNVENWDCGALCGGDTVGTNVVEYFNTPWPYGNHGYVAINDRHKAIIVGIRGSWDLDSLKSDADALLITYDKYPKALVHEGFFSVNRANSAQLVSLVTEQAKKYPKYRVIITGHSLGAAISILFTLDLIDEGGIAKERLFTYAYGSPRVGNPEFANYVTSLGRKGYQFFRAANRNDWIPQLPPVEYKGWYYQQYAPEYWVNEHADLVKCTTAESLACSRGDDPHTALWHNHYFGTDTEPYNLWRCKNGSGP